MALTPGQRAEILAELQSRGVDTSKFSLSGAAAPSGRAPTTNDLLRSPVYAKKRAEGQAKADEKEQADIDAGLNAAGMASRELRGLRETVRQAPSGSFAGVRESLGKNVGNVLGGLPFIPSREEAIALENLRGAGAQGVLGDVKKLPGPLSEKELAFLQQLQVNPYATRERNEFVVRGAEWANKWRSEYLSGKQAWMNRLGSPNATNRDGLTYDQWWRGWADRNMPVPDMKVPSRRDKANAALKAKSAPRPASGGVRVLEVYN